MRPQQSRSQRNAVRSKYSKVIRSMLSKVRRLSTDKSGACTRITFVDKVFRDLYGIKSFARRAASCKTLSQVFNVFNEVGIKDLWSLLDDGMYFDVVSLLVDVQERKYELKKIIRKAQKKLQSSGGTLRVDQKSKHNKRISNAQAELKWLNKRYRDSIESLQDSLGIHNPDSGDYKDRFAALKNFADRGTISSGNYWDMEDDGYDFNGWMMDDPYTMRNKRNPFDGIDMDDFEDDMTDMQQDDRLDRIEDQIKALTSMMQTGRVPVQKNPYAPSAKGVIVDDQGTRVQPSPIESKMIEMMNVFGQSIDKLSGRLDDIEDAIVNDPDNDEYGGYPDPYNQYQNPQVRPVNGPTQEDLERMMQGMPAQQVESESDTAPYSPDIRQMPYQPNEPVMPGVPTQQEIRKASPNVIDANNRQEVFQKPTDFQRMQGEAKTPSGSPNSNP